MDEVKTQEVPAAEKKPYDAPELVRYGGIEEITEVKGFGIADAGDSSSFP